VDWLARRHPVVAARWDFAENITNRPSADFRANRPEHLVTDVVDLDRVTLLLSPQDGGEPLRLLLDAAARRIPLVIAAVPRIEEFFLPAEAAFVTPFNPLALAHALLDFEANPAGYQRRAARAQQRVRAANNPELLLPRWQALLETATATRG
jgi:glycosyltransferase involved in cell wall biosynthesis